MNYVALINAVADRTGYTEAAIREVFKHLRTVMLENLKDVGDSVNFHQLGVFKVKRRAAKKVTTPFLGVDVGGRPKTGIIPEHLVVKFRNAKTVKTLLNP